MMILAKTRVADFDTFWKVFNTKGVAQRERFGSKGSRVLRSADDPNEVWVLFDWTREGFEAFVADPDTPGIMKEAGLLSPPEPLYLDEVGEASS